MGRYEDDPCSCAVTAGVLLSLCTIFFESGLSLNLKFTALTGKSPGVHLSHSMGVADACYRTQLCV